MAQPAPTTRATLPPGLRVLGEYILERPLERTAAWVTYVGWHTARERERYHVRVLRREAASRLQLIEAFARQAQILEALDHRGIVRVVASGVDQGVPLIVSPAVEGTTLAERLAASSAGLGSREVVRIAAEVADVLTYLHAKRPPIVHRALTPAKILLSEPDDRVFVLEVGHAHALAMATPDGVIASPAPAPYRAPEDLTSGAEVGPAVDQFALASVVFECLTGIRAFDGDDAAAITKIAEGRRPRIARVRPELPAALEPVLQRAWALEPAARFPDVQAFVSALAAALDVALPTQFGRGTANDFADEPTRVGATAHVPIAGESESANDGASQPEPAREVPSAAAAVVAEASAAHIDALFEGLVTERDTAPDPSPPRSSDVPAAPRARVPTPPPPLPRPAASAALAPPPPPTQPAAPRAADTRDTVPNAPAATAPRPVPRPGGASAPKPPPPPAPRDPKGAARAAAGPKPEDVPTKEIALPPRAPVEPRTRLPTPPYGKAGPPPIPTSHAAPPPVPRPGASSSRPNAALAAFGFGSNAMTTMPGGTEAPASATPAPSAIAPPAVAPAAPAAPPATLAPAVAPAPSAARAPADDAPSVSLAEVSFDEPAASQPAVDAAEPVGEGEGEAFPGSGPRLSVPTPIEPVLVARSSVPDIAPAPAPAPPAAPPAVAPASAPISAPVAAPVVTAATAPPPSKVSTEPPPPPPPAPAPRRAMPQDPTEKLAAVIDDRRPEARRSGAVLVAWLLGGAMVVAASVFTGNVVLHQRAHEGTATAPRVAAPANPSTSAPPVAPPPVAPPRPSAPSLGTAAPPQQAAAPAQPASDAAVAQTSGAVVAPAQPEPAVAPAPSSDGPLPEHPRGRALSAVRRQIAERIAACPTDGRRHGRHARVAVTYEGRTGRATDVTIRGSYFTGQPIGACIEAAVRAVPVGPFTDPQWETDLVFMVH